MIAQRLVCTWLASDYHDGAVLQYSLARNQHRVGFEDHLRKR